MKNNIQSKNQNAAEKNAVMYTRVATISQEEGMSSLQFQEKRIEEYAIKEGYKIVSHFGGHHRSDDLQEFRRMMKYIKDSKEKISYVLVLTPDRISRIGINAKFISEKLLNAGVKIIYAAHENVTPESEVVFNLLNIFSKYENEVRKRHISYRKVEKLKQGYWVGKAPLGFDTIIENGEQKIVVNDEGKIIQKAFYLKAIGGGSNTQIAEKLFSWGLKISAKRLKKIFKNPFYCGLIVHSLLQGQVIQGKQEVLIPRDVFFQINNF